MQTGITVGYVDVPIGENNIGDGAVMAVAHGAAMSVSGADAFVLDTPYLLWSLRDLNRFGTTINAASQAVPNFKAANPMLYEAVRKIYERVDENRPVWIVAHDTEASGFPSISTYINVAVAQEGWRYAPKMVAVGNTKMGQTPPASAATPGTSPLLSDWVKAFEAERKLAFDNKRRFTGFIEVPPVVVTAATDGTADIMTAFNTGAPQQLDYSTFAFGDIAIVDTLYEGVDWSDETAAEKYSDVFDMMGKKMAVGYEVSVGSMLNGQDHEDGFVAVYNTTTSNMVYLSVRSFIENTLAVLGQKQHVFTREREQADGVYYNDEATANDKNMALSSVQMSVTKNISLDVLEATYSRTVERPVPEYGRDGHITLGSKMDLASMGENALLSGVRGLVLASVRDSKNRPAIYEGAPSYVSSLHYRVEAKIAVIRPNKTQEIELSYTV